MFAAIDTPAFGLQSILRDPTRFESHPIVLLETVAERKAQKGAAPVIAATTPALATGISLGMTATHAQARCPHLLLHDEDPESETSTTADLLTLAPQWTPDFEATSPGTITLDLSGHPSPNLKLAQEIVTQHRRQHLVVSCGLAAHADLALLAARLAPPSGTHIFSGQSFEEIETELAKLPLTALTKNHKLLQILDLWGIKTAGHLTRLPRQELVSRLGPEAGTLWTQCHGGRPRLLHLVSPTQTYDITSDLDYEIETTAPLLFLLRRNLETLAARLTGNGHVAGSLELTIMFVRKPPYQRTFRIPEPTSEVDRLYQLLDTHLESLILEAPVTGFSINVEPTRPSRRQHDLFEPFLKDPTAFHDTLARLSALLGENSIGSPRLLPTHRPDSIELTPFEIDAPTPLSLTDSPTRTSLPLRRFRPPRPAEVTTEIDDHGFLRPQEFIATNLTEVIVNQHGPWLASGSWWTPKSSHWAREEWDIQTTTGALYLLVRSPEGSWHIEGVYG